MSPAAGLPIEAIADLCRRHGVARLWLFGSAATGEFDPLRSDYDFLVEFGPRAAGTRADAYFGMLDDLRELMQRPVDLVEIGAVRNRYVRASIESTRIPLYAAA